MPDQDDLTAEGIALAAAAAAAASPTGSNGPDQGAAPAPAAAPAGKGFPENTPIADMTAEQQVAYWKHHDRRKSDLLKQYGGITPEQARQYQQAAEDVRRENLQPSERALEDARTQAQAAARAAAAAELAPVVAEAIVGQFVTDETQRTAVLSVLKPEQFVTDTGGFDKDALIGALTGLASAFAPAQPKGTQPPSQWGQSGARPPAPSAREQGIAEAKRRGYIK